MDCEKHAVCQWYYHKEVKRWHAWPWLRKLFHKGKLFKNLTYMKNEAVLYPAIFWGCWFFDKRREEKNCYAARKCGWWCKLYPVGSRGCDNEWWGKLTPESTILRVWGSEFGIVNQYTGFKVTLDMALLRHISKMKLLAKIVSVLKPLTFSQKGPS